MAKRYRSSIPEDVVERVVCRYRRKGAGVWLKKTECLVAGIVVGERFYDKDGSLLIEPPCGTARNTALSFIGGRMAVGWNPLSHTVKGCPMARQANGTMMELSLGRIP
jgi:hypothetical protein